jgi:flavin-dependent dehydrogenase
MSQDNFDALVIGGGPGGSTAASFMALAGKKVLLLEKEVFPRFHIGESLLPYNMRIFNELGVIPALEAAGFPRKFGATFELGDGSKSAAFIFRDGIFTKEIQAFQVERAIFDHILLKNTRRLGVDAREGWSVRRTQTNRTGATLEAVDPSGKPATFTGSYLVDASGRGNLTGNQDGLRVMHPRHKKLALFGHFHDVEMGTGERRGDTLITRLSNKWFWFIPVSSVKTSVGCVLDAEEYGRWKGTQEELFRRLIQSSPPASARMKNAQIVEPLQTTADFSYHNRRLIGERTIRVGDAAGFLDPIFSSGVFMAMLSGRLGAHAILESMSNGGSTRPLKRYEKKFFRALKFYWEMIEGFYTTPFMEVLMEPRDKWDLPSAVNAALAGELYGDWQLRWRMRVFFLLIKLQGRRPFLPRIRFPSSAIDA